MELQPIELEFHQKFYPMHVVHRDRNYIYNFWPREGESIAQAWGRLKSMLYLCPNHELAREMIIQKKLSSASSQQSLHARYFLYWFFYDEDY